MNSLTGNYVIFNACLFDHLEATLNDTCLIAGWLGGQSCSFLPLGAHSAGQAGFVSHNDCKMIYPVKLLAWPAVW